MIRARSSLLFGAAAALAFGIQGCAPDAGTPTAPAVNGPALIGGTPPAWELTKTADPYWNRSFSYDWSLTKTVSPASAVLNQGQSATFTYTLTATRGAASSSGDGFGMSGQICVKNNSGAPTVDLRIEDRLFELVSGTVIRDIVVDVSGNPVLDPGESHCYPYTLTMPDGFVPVAGGDYKNAAYVISTVAGKPTRMVQTAVAVTWPATPSTGGETDEAAFLADVVTCPAGFTCTPGSGGWSLTGSSITSVPVVVTNVNATCSSEFTVKNAAKLTENDSGTEHAAGASVMVNTQECAPPPSIHGCTPGYWKQKQHFDSWIGYTQERDYDQVFGVNVFEPNKSLLQALGNGGGGIARLGRHSTAALLNTANSGVQYGMTTAQVIAMVQQAVASGNYDWASDHFERLNERGCPLN